MKLKLIILICVSPFLYGQNITFDIAENYINIFGQNNDMVTFSPLFLLESDTIHNKKKSERIRKAPNFSNPRNVAYGFILFNGVKNSEFENELVFLLEDYDSNLSNLYIDRNGNLDFTDDGKPIQFTESFLFSLSNSEIENGDYYYYLSRSKIDKKNYGPLRNRYSNKYPKNMVLSPKYWLVKESKSVRFSDGKINGKPIYILINDADIDGIYTFEPGPNGDRILIFDKDIDQTQEVSKFLRQGEPIDHNAVFELHGKKYALKALSTNGSQLTIIETNKNTRVSFGEGKNVSDFSVHLLSGKLKSLSNLIKDKPLLLYIGGTWCGGSKAQEPTIKKMYQEGLVDVVGLFAHDTKARILDYIDMHHIDWPMGLLDEKFKEKFRINSFPTYILVSKEGHILIIERNAKKLYQYLKNN